MKPVDILLVFQSRLSNLYLYDIVFVKGLRPVFMNNKKSGCAGAAKTLTVWCYHCQSDYRVLMFPIYCKPLFLKLEDG